MEDENEDEDKKRSIEGKQPITPSWRTDYEIYKIECWAAFDRFYDDFDWIRQMKRYYPSPCAIKRTLEKMAKQFWITEAGWKNKKDAARGKPNYVIDWKATIERNFSKNRVYFGKEETDDEQAKINAEDRR